MPKNNLKKNSRFQLNPAMKMVTNSLGIPDYAAKFAKENAQSMEDLKDRISDFAHTTKVFGDIDKRSGEYLNIINDPKIGISGSAVNNPVQRMFTKGTNKKYPYLYSRFDPNANPDYGAIFAGNNSDMRIVNDNDFVQYDDNGNVVTYQSGVDQNSLRAQNYLKNLNIAGRAWHGLKDKSTLSKAEADAKLSAFTFDTLTESMRSGNIAAADQAIALANSQYNPGKNRLFKSQASAFIGEQFMGPIGDTFSGQNLNQIIFNTGDKGGGYHAGQYMDKGYFDRVGIHNKSIIPSSGGQVKFEHRRMLGGINTLHNIAKRIQTEKNQADKKSYDINKDYKYQFEKIGNKIKNTNFNISIPQFDTKSGGFNIKLNIKDSKSGE